jgi:hypothetical protein
VPSHTSGATPCKHFAQDCSARLKDHAQAMAQKAGRPFIYLSNSSQSKEQLARDIATRDRIEQGLVN